jgi:hypothetical protein
MYDSFYMEYNTVHYSSLNILSKLFIVKDEDEEDDDNEDKYGNDNDNDNDDGGCIVF